MSEIGRSKPQKSGSVASRTRPTNRQPPAAAAGPREAIRKARPGADAGSENGGSPPAREELVSRRRASTIDTRSLIFDPLWYWEQYPDVAALSLDPVQHYLCGGAAEGRNPNPFFDTLHYCTVNPDVVTSGMNPFLHYILYGAREGRSPRG